MKISFRVDSADFMGGGHLMRCLNLAEALRDRGAEIHFICRRLPGCMLSLLEHKNLSFTVLPPPAWSDNPHEEDYTAWLGVTQNVDAEQTIATLAGANPDWLVIDHYAIDSRWQRHLRNHAKKLLVIDDLANRAHDCDILLDQNFFLEPKHRYAGLTPASCRLLLGPNFALLNKQFDNFREKFARHRAGLKNVLVFFTAGDDQGETLKAMQGLESFDKVEKVDVVTGQWRAEIAEKCRQLNWTYHYQIDYMPKLIAEADLAIGSGGISNWERCALGAPTLIAVLSQNQAPIAEALHQAGIVYNLGWSSKLQARDYCRALNSLSVERLAAMSSAAAALVDGKGASRVADILLY